MVLLYEVYFAGMVSQFVEDLIHFKTGEDGFDQYGSFYGSVWDVQVVLGKLEDLVPQAGLQVAFQFRKIEI